MKRYSFALVVCFGLILSRSRLSISDITEYFGSGRIGEALAYDCFCYTPLVTVRH